MLRTLKSAPDIHAASAGLHPPFVHLVVQRISRTVSESLTRSCTAIKWDYHYPRGPRSCPSYVVSSRHHLLDPIRPTRGHIAISPHGGLYAMSSLCGSAEATPEWFRAFAAHSFLTCRPLRPRGVRCIVQSKFRCRRGLRHGNTGSALPIPPAIRFTWGDHFGASPVRNCYGLPGCSPPWTDLTGIRVQPQETFTSRLSTERSP